MVKVTTDNIIKGMIYSDRRHEARLAVRRAIGGLLDELSPTLSRELALEIIVESAVGFRAWDQQSLAEISLQVGRLARRVRSGEPIEMWPPASASNLKGTA